MQIKIEKEPYEEGQKIFKKNIIELEPNAITCLVGCNGSGKSTLLKEIIDHIDAEQITTDNSCKGLTEIFKFLSDKVEVVKDIYYYIFDKSTETSNSFDEDMYNRLAHGQQSTGENIIRRFGKGLQVLGNWIRENKGKKLFIFFDDCDAGTSIDMINDIKDVFDLIIEDCKRNSIEYYMILTSNSYEMCKDLNCISVIDFKPKKFKTYESYKKFVLKTRAEKEKRYKD